MRENDEMPSPGFLQAPERQHLLSHAAECLGLVFLLAMNLLDRVRQLQEHLQSTANNVTCLRLLNLRECVSESFGCLVIVRVALQRFPEAADRGLALAHPL